MNAITMQPVTAPFRASVRVPGSKSITNRALPLAAMAAGRSVLSGVLFADDTWAMIRALERLGYSMDVNESARTVAITGRGKEIPNCCAELFCGNSGTTLRFLAAFCARVPGNFTFDGITRMRQRPVDELARALCDLGSEVNYKMEKGFPPIIIKGDGLRGGVTEFTNAKSSQYISAILMAAPHAISDVTVRLLGPITSEPYVAMTLRMMEQFGLTVKVADSEGLSGKPMREITVPAGQSARAQNYAIEPDASNASYFLAAAAVNPGSTITIEGLGIGSLQGDVAFADVLHQMGAGLTFGRDFITVTGNGDLQGIDLDMNAIPDMVQTLAVVALFAKGTTRIRNVANLRVKETDRLAALQAELTKLGARVETTQDSISITPPESGTLNPASIATYDDHRMAMSFAIAGLKSPGVTILDPGCTAKTYPEYFADLAKAVGQNS